MKKLSLLLSLLLSLSLFASVLYAENHKSSVESIKKNGILKVGVFSDKPPFGYVDKNGKNQGFDIYIAKRLAKDLLGDENKIEFVLVEAASRVEFLQAGKVDLIMANFTVTKEREEIVSFAKPYMKVSLGVISLEKNQITDINQLKNKNLIVNKGTTADIYFTDKHPEIKLLKFDQNTEAFNALIDERGVALAHDNTLLFAWAARNKNYKVGLNSIGNLDTIAPAVQKNNSSLLNWLDQEIKTLTVEKFFHKAYEETLAPVYGDSVKPEFVLIENGDL